MFQIQDFNKPRPPLVSFHVKCSSQKDADGMPLYVDQHFVHVTPHGSKDVLEKDVKDWFDGLQMLVEQGRFDPDWLRQYKAAYAEWKLTGEIPVDGIPLRNWPVLTPGELQKCLDAKLRSVEDLAAANEETLGRIGMGGRALKQRAGEWLVAKKDVGPIIAQIESQRVMLQNLEMELKALRTQNKELQFALDQVSRRGGQSAVVANEALPPLETRLEMARDDLPRDNTGDLVDDVVERAIG